MKFRHKKNLIFFRMKQDVRRIVTFILALSFIRLPVCAVYTMSSTYPEWFSASFIKLSREEKNIILDFCIALNLTCKCNTLKKNNRSKYCELCIGILHHHETSEIVIDKYERISVKHILKYYRSIKT